MAKDYGREIWGGLVEHVRNDDGLPVFETKGFWTAHKLYFLCQYLEQATRGMKSGRTKFPGGMTYIDLFCGSGVSVVRSATESPKRFPGSPLIAAAMPSAFDRLVLVDQNSTSLDASCKRISNAGYKGKIHAHCGDINADIDRVIELVPSGSLNIAFVDPYSLDVHLDTIRRLAQNRALDLIILFSDRFDLVRNVYKHYYPSEEESKLDAFLGYRDWRERLDALDDRSGPRVPALFAAIYQEQLLALGYPHTKHWPLEGPHGPSFRLFFASKHPLGLRFCEIALKRNFAGDQQLFAGL